MALFVASCLWFVGCSLALVVACFLLRAVVECCCMICVSCVVLVLSYAVRRLFFVGWSS